MPLRRLAPLVLLALLASCAAALGVSDALGRSARTVVRAPGPLQRVVVATDAGDVRVRAVPQERRVEVRRAARWLLAQPRVEQVLRGDTLEVRARCTVLAALGPCATDLEVLVPSGVDVAAATDGGEVRASGLGGRIDLSARGDVEGRELRPLVARARSRAGTVRLAFRNAPLQVEVAGAGDAVLRVPRGDDYRLDGEVAGRVRLDDVFRSDLASRRIDADLAGDLAVLGR